MTIKQSLVWASKKIPSLEAEILLSHILKVNRVSLYANYDERLKKSIYKKFQNKIKQRLSGEPIAYLINHKEFFGLDFYVDKRVLIPRPETEILVEEAIKQLKNQPSLSPKKRLPRKQNLKTIADIGTGSGCIAITLAKKLSNIKIYATDISKNALKVAKINAKKHKVSNRIQFLHGNLLSPLPKRVDLIIANLPYVVSDFDKINPFEPKVALFGGKNGLVLIKKLLKQAPKHLNKKGIILLEIDAYQKNPLKKIISQYLPKHAVKFKKDLAYLDRVAIIKLL